MPIPIDVPQALPDLAPAERTSLTDAVAIQLADAIVERELGPGERLPAERDLAARLRVSRIVVREALGRLAQRGLVEVRPGVGTFVASPPEHAVTDTLQLYIRRHRIGNEHLFEVRHALEPAIAAAASRHADEEQLAALSSNVERTAALAARMDERVDEGTAEAFAWTDLEFHNMLARAGGNPLFELLLAPLIDRLLDVRRIGVRLPGTARRAAQGHRAVLRAVAARDPDAAARHMREHLRDVQSWLPSTPTPSASRRDPQRARRPEEAP